MIKFRRNYPRIIITAEDRYDLESIRSDLSVRGIYVNRIALSDVESQLSDADILVIYSPEYSSRIKVLYDKIAFGKVKKLIYVGSERDIEALPETLILPDDSASICATLHSIIKESFNIDTRRAEDDEILCELGKPPQVYYNGTKISLSKSEAKIIHFLLTLEPRMLVSKETIGEYLSLAPGAVPVHIHNINDKSMQTYHDKLVFSRSNRGYFVY